MLDRIKKILSVKHISQRGFFLPLLILLVLSGCTTDQTVVRKIKSDIVKASPPPSIPTPAPKSSSQKNIKPTQPPKASKASKPKIVKARLYSGKIHKTFSQSASKAGVSKRHIKQLESLFAEQINFRKDLRRGDKFKVIVRGDKILAAELLNRGEPVQIIHHTNRKGLSRFYNIKGKPLGADFLRTPLKSARISSHFTLKRYHPVLKIYRPHRGTDFKARTGVKIYATANGIVEKRERQKGYGNVIFLSHGGGLYTTVYAHLSRFEQGIKVGKKVKQGDLLGYVGSTGLVTGPHLHYEFREKGEYKDAMKVALPRSRRLSTEERRYFYKMTAGVRRALLQL